MWCAAFAAGCGGAIEDVIEGGGAVLRDGPVALFGSPRLWPLLTRARAEGRTWWYGDKAYLGREAYYRITRDAFQHDGSGQAGPERFRRTGWRVRPWRSGGGHVLVCPPSEAFQRLMGTGGWLPATLATLARHTDRPIRVRAKPPHHLRDRDPLAPHLEGAHAVVTFMSNAAVEAVLAGIPVFVTGRCAASAMGLADLALIESPLRPDGREQWAWNLAANQWTLPEIRAGLAWRMLQEHR